MDNSIEQYAIGELLDGRYFYIPSYQRGYRWTDKQVDDLLRDLLCFANDTKDDYDFYCLQPIIARPITDEKKLKELFRRTRQTLWSAVQMLTQKLCCQTIHDCPKVVPLHYESE